MTCGRDLDAAEDYTLPAPAPRGPGLVLAGPDARGTVLPFVPFVPFVLPAAALH